MQKPSANYFYVKTKILPDFHICISLSLEFTMVRLELSIHSLARHLFACRVFFLTQIWAPIFFFFFFFFVKHLILFFFSCSGERANAVSEVRAAALPSFTKSFKKQVMMNHYLRKVADYNLKLSN